MTNKKLELLFELANQLHKEELKKSGMLDLPYSFAFKHESGECVIFSPSFYYTDKIQKQLRRIEF